MRFFYFYLLFGLAPLGALAQTSRPAPTAPPDTVRLDDDRQPTQVLEDCHYLRLVRRDASGRPTGTVRTLSYPGKKLLWTGKLTSESPEVWTGLCTSYYPNGRMAMRGTYIGGVAQVDLQRWDEKGTAQRCRVSQQTVLETEEARLHSYYNDGDSRHIYTVDLPDQVLSVVYRLDIRDEDEPTIGWSTVTALLPSNALLTTMQAMTALTQSMSVEAAQQPKPKAATKSRYFITTDLAHVRTFTTYATKGTMPLEGGACLRRITDTNREVRPLYIPPGTRRLYICVGNDNYKAAAIARVSVTALVSQCQ